ncbi:hypothetical protein L2E82_01953 [Cichorium intybus]|uniref:Uncharacterized protein n=1 Tax=Cichorium intybus TaxID=13427 RepID=A0ACB9H0A1_CICIN|nr:hypothetical protein L2E82_01953 [Cichorium intybus]
MEKDFGSECSSECESGWTFYLGHSMYPCDPLQKPKKDDNDDDDDMSMVSDASSGPPHFHEQECNNNGVNRKIQDLPCFLDDTFSYVGNDKATVGEGDNDVEDYSEGESRLCQHQFEHFKFSVYGTQLKQNQLRKP